MSDQEDSRDFLKELPEADTSFLFAFGEELSKLRPEVLSYQRFQCGHYQPDAVRPWYTLRLAYVDHLKCYVDLPKILELRKRHSKSQDKSLPDENYFLQQIIVDALWGASLRVAPHEIALAVRNSFSETVSGKDADMISKPEPLNMKDLYWREVHFVFSENAIRIKARDLNKRFNFASLGFQDGRKGDASNSEWILLACFARNNGRIPRRNDLPSKISKNLPKWVSLLRKRLRSLTQIDDNPVLWKDGFYQTQFHIELNATIEEVKENEDEIKELFKDETRRFTKHRRDPA